MMPPCKYRVSILGQSYQVVSDESERDVIAAVDRVDRLLREILAKSTVIDHQKAAVLAALKLALEHTRLEQHVMLQEDQQAKLMSLIAHAEM